MTSLLARSLKPVAPAVVPPMPWYFQPALSPTLRPMLFTLSIVGLLVSFLLGVRYVPH